MNRPSIETIKAMVNSYENGKHVKDVATAFGYSTGKTYYILRDAGCKFRPKRTGPHTEETRRKISDATRGKIVSDESRRKESETKRFHYNGFNGQGHTKVRSDGYLQTFVPDHPNASADGYVMTHTLIMERHIGRYLMPHEVVHHINHVRDDNRLENLSLMDRHEHLSMHMRERNAKRRNDLLTK
jgi:hypothetical protein